MAKSKKTPSKAFTKKVQNIVKGDVVKSVAIASVLLNVLFLVSIVVLTSTNAFDHHFYNAARNHYCANSSAVKDLTEELGNEEAAKAQFEVDCVGKDFLPFYKEALQKFKAEANQ